VLSVSASTRAFGSAKSDAVAQRVKTCSLSFASILRFNSSLRFAAISARSSSMLPLAMPKAFGELGVDLGHVRRFDALHRQARNRRAFPRPPRRDKSAGR
jgi:hypothetical protein